MDEIKRLAAGLSPAAAIPPKRSRILAVVTPAFVTPAVESGEMFTSPSDNDHRIQLRTEHVFTLDDAVEAKLRRARELLAHRYPMGDLESLFEAALDALLDAVDPSRRTPRQNPPPRPFADQTRRIPEWVKSKVRERDEERCAFVSAEGHRCGERRFLRFDHIVPWSLGGRSDDPKNVRQLCGAHNRWAWRHAFVTRS